MPSLDNPRHERFAQELAKGKPAVEAYKEAGYSEKSANQNAHRLSENEGVRGRVRQLKERAAQRVDVTLNSITQQLMEDREVARENNQPAAMVQADRALAKIHGLEIERIDATHRTVTDDPMRPEDWTQQYTDATH